MSRPLRRPAVVALAAFLAACSAPVSSSPAAPSASIPVPSIPLATASIAATSQKPTPAASFAAMPGMSFDAAIAWAQGFSMECQTGLIPPNGNLQLVIALCRRQSASDNAQVDLTIQYWPNNTVLAVSAAAQPISGGIVSDDFGVAFSQWMSRLPYAGADANATLDWLLSDDACSAGCTRDFGSVSWTHTVSGKVDAVSAFVPE